MPRQPDTACGTCGKPCFKSRAPAGSGWNPPLTHTCNACRRGQRQHGTVSMYKRGKCRCDLCRQAHSAACIQYQRSRRAPLVRSCTECGAEFNPRSNQVLCSPECRKVRLGRVGDHASRAAFYGVNFETVDRAAIFDRDGWVCGICELPVERGLRFPDPGYPTLDHIVPMSLGGAHSAENLQLAHFYCNTVKGNRIEVDECLPSPPSLVIA